MSIGALLRKKVALAVVLIVWLPAVAFGINILWKYSTTPGRPATPSAQWPDDTKVDRAPGRATLVMFAHPKCPCTSATLGELAIIMVRTQGQLNADVFFYKAPHTPSDWDRTDLWTAAGAIPGVRVFEDNEGKIAERFGAFTSGQTLVYDPAGRLEFKGGITAFRGHSGDNTGRSAIIALVHGDQSMRTALPITTPVLGCSLRGE